MNSFQIPPLWFEVNVMGIAGLLIWSAMNIAIGIVFIFIKRGFLQYFWQANVVWNLISGVLALILLHGIFDALHTFSSEAAFTTYTANSLKFLIINSVLDIFYMVAGYAVFQMGFKRKSVRLAGYGNAFLLQGAFLFSLHIFLTFLNFGYQ